MHKLQENKETIHKKEEAIEQLTREQENQRKLVSRMESIRHENYTLSEQNDSLREQTKAYDKLLKEKELKIATYQKLRKENKELRRREQFLVKQLEKHIRIFKELNHPGKTIQQQEWPLLINTIDLLNSNFTSRLQKQAPSLTESDIHYCCLIKLNLPTSTIANLMAVSPPTVTKRKQRIRNRINQNTNSLLGETASLDEFLASF